MDSPASLPTNDIRNVDGPSSDGINEAIYSYFSSSSVQIAAHDLSKISMKLFWWNMTLSFICLDPSQNQNEQGNSATSS